MGQFHVTEWTKRENDSVKKGMVMEDGLGSLYSSTPARRVGHGIDSRHSPKGELSISFARWRS